MTSTASTLQPDVAVAAHPRPTGAKRRVLVSLRLRLALLVALSTAAVIGIQSYLEVRVFEGAVETDLQESARLMALAVADDYELRSDPIDHAALAADLRELVGAAPTLRTLTIVQVVDGTPAIVASTSSGERTEAIDLALRAIRSGQTESEDVGASAAAVATPITKPNMPPAAAVATVSLAARDQLRTTGRKMTLWFTPAAIIVLTLLVDGLGRRLIHRPIGRILDTMTRAGEGDFTARAEVARRDEIGGVADGLNDMLRRLQDFNVALQDRVDEATAEVKARNEELVESYQRVFVLREALARAEQLAAVGQMAASVAHQVGTPLNLISGYVQMIQADPATDTRAGRRLAIVQEQIAKVAAVVRTMLDQSRRAGDVRAIELAPLLSRVADVARAKLDASGIALGLDVEPGLPAIEADAEEIELALLNLVTNSLDAMPGGGELTIRAAGLGDRVRVQISDTGSGISGDLLPKIFHPWVTTKPAGRGTGLGLSITQAVVQRHHGTITATSDPGRRTTFTIELPAAGTAPATDDHVQHPDR